MRARPPALQLTIELEELPVVRTVSDTAEDEERLLVWLANPAVRARISAAVLDALDELGRAA